MPALQDARIVNRHRVQPNHANNYGSISGGVVMKWMDEIGAMSAMRFAGEPCVTAAMNGLDFRRPVPVGDTVLVDAYPYDAGRTSVTVRVRAAREDPRTGESAWTTDAHFVFVAVRDGAPTAVPDLDVESEEERRLRAAARESAPAGQAGEQSPSDRSP